MLVTIPSISEGGKRYVWCPRTLEELKKIAREHDALSGASPGRTSTYYDDFDCIIRLSGTGQRFVNRIPEWNSDTQSLTLNFIGEN